MTLQTFVLSMWETLVQLAPWLLLGALAAGLIHAFLPRDFVQRQLRGGRGVLKAVLVGVPLPLCSCGVIPAGLGLKKDGAGDGAALGFLISTPQTGVDSMLVSATFLGWPFAVFKVFAAGITGVAGGWWADRLEGADAQGAPPAATLEGTAEREGRRELASIPRHALELLRSIWRWILFGVVVSAAIDTLLPPEFLVAWGGLGTLGASLAVLVVSLPLYVCATASVPIAAALVAGGMPAGAALVFLMAGPATNVATIGAIYRAFGRRIVGVYLAVIVVGSVAFGWLFDRFFEGWGRELTAHEHGAAPWEIASAWALLALTIYFAAEEFSAWRRRRSLRPAGDAAPSVSIPVRGMTCAGCAAQLERAVGGVPGVSAVEVNLEPGDVTVYGAVDSGRLREAIRSSGFEPG